MNRLFRLRTILTAILVLILVQSAVADNKTDAVDKLLSQWDKKDTPGFTLDAGRVKNLRFDKK